MPARIEDVMPDHGMVTLSHAPIAAWNWPAMSMDFQVADTVSLEQLKDGMDIHAELERIAEDKVALRGVHVDDDKTKAPSDEGMDHGETSNAERGQQDVMSHQGHATGESK